MSPVLVFQGLTCFLVSAIFSAVLGMFQFGYNTGVINAPQQVSQSVPDKLCKYVQMGIENYTRGEPSGLGGGAKGDFESAGSM